jgi:hypothetical protein
MESALAFTVGLIALLAILRFDSQYGAFFVAAIAVYTLIRQGPLRPREERRQSNRGATLVAIAAALTLVDARMTAVQSWSSSPAQHRRFVPYFTRVIG